MIVLQPVFLSPLPSSKQDMMWRSLSRDRRLLPHAVVPTFSSTAQQSEPPALLKLIPRRVANQVAMRTSSPFSRSASIGDEQAYQLYAAIDGRRTLGELATVTGLETKAVAKALRVLHKENCIRMYDVAGQLVERAL